VGAFAVFDSELLAGAGVTGGVFGASDEDDELEDSDDEDSLEGLADGVAVAVVPRLSFL
jgi:hypothetical protein